MSRKARNKRELDLIRRKKSHNLSSHICNSSLSSTNNEIEASKTERMNNELSEIQKQKIFVNILDSTFSIPDYSEPSEDDYKKNISSADRIKKELDEMKKDRMLSASYISTPHQEIISSTENENRNISEHGKEKKEKIEGKAIKDLNLDDIKKLKENRDVEGLIQVLREKNQFWRGWVIEYLTDIGDPRAINVLWEISQDNNEYYGNLNGLAKKAIDKFRDERAVDTFIEWLKKRDSKVREFAARQLKWIGNRKSFIPLMEAYEKFGPYQNATESAIWELIGKTNSDDFRMVHYFSENGNKDTRVLCIKILRKMNEKPSIDALIMALNENDKNARWDALFAMKGYNDPKAIQPLINIMMDESAYFLTHSTDDTISLRCMAVDLLGEIRDDRVIFPLWELIHRENAEKFVDFKLIKSAAQALGKLRPNDPDVVQLLKDTCKK